jgi:hypothetical protein
MNAAPACECDSPFVVEDEQGDPYCLKCGRRAE